MTAISASTQWVALVIMHFSATPSRGQIRVAALRPKKGGSMSLARVHGGRCVAARLRRSAGLCLMLASLSFGAFADEAPECQAASGTLIVGRVVSAPTFKHGVFRKGVELSHTHLTLRSDTDGKDYDVAVDNVFASGYQQGAKVVPAPLDSIEVGDALEACGIPFAGGMHWVHNNCGDTPTPQEPNGWIKKIAADGGIGPNLEDGQRYCYLWSHR
ncbi:hypothetical protein Q2T91_08345 [Ralstonia pseudosolanacearum]|uniref:hypothetical protein n=1 Tax=Ralstonia pseudosolanacearum TaxID=1310165 RepID=UPI001FF90378|nr:hypothetical protein [Ralstonia pseudosolanacearum]